MGYYLVRIGAQRLKNKGYGALWFQRIKAKYYQLQKKTRLFYRQKPSETPVNKGVPVVFSFPYKARTPKTPETSIDKGISRDFTSDKKSQNSSDKK